MIRRKFNNQEVVNSELHMRYLSKKAMDYYYGTYPLYVYEVDTDDGKRYYVRGVVEADALSFGQLDEMFRELEEEMEACL